MFFSRYKCKCGDNASWFYMPYKIGKVKKDNYYCDICIDRGCSCQVINMDYSNRELYTEQYKDELGRHFPCMEYDYLGFPGSYGRNQLEDWFIIVYYTIINFVNSYSRKFWNKNIL